MLGWALTFLVAALFAAPLGFGGIVGIQATIAQVMFFVFLALAAGTMLRRLARGKPPF
ncbi:DUF1328 domain-containing protein [Falsirhodobacter xinxiangensis]|uniref:DUF1328 domain-containing protein n=1 Tax=Falsirhodobacter xinxiangensis TaxID=2530049 RepID=UPI0010A99604|nr:DUF1328 domain-containing protein [Rhodobacter xinxiangensis]